MQHSRFIDSYLNQFYYIRTVDNMKAKITKYEYVIKVNNKIVWHGLNPKEKYWEIKNKNPGKEVGIAWQSQEDVLVC